MLITPLYVPGGTAEGKLTSSRMVSVSFPCAVVALIVAISGHDPPEPLAGAFASVRLQGEGVDFELPLLMVAITSLDGMFTAFVLRAAAGLEKYPTVHTDLGAVLKNQLVVTLIGPLAVPMVPAPFNVNVMLAGVALTLSDSAAIMDSPTVATLLVTTAACPTAGGTTKTKVVRTTRSFFTVVSPLIKIFPAHNAGKFGSLGPSEYL
jgi:hypothetical protein